MSAKKEFNEKSFQALLNTLDWKPVAKRDDLFEAELPPEHQSGYLSFLFSTPLQKYVNKLKESRKLTRSANAVSGSSLQLSVDDLLQYNIDFIPSESNEAAKPFSI